MVLEEKSIINLKDLLNRKDDLYEDLRGVFCVYRIFDESNRSYIGITSDLWSRLFSNKFGHLFRLEFSNHPLYEAMREQGLNKFSIQILSFNPGSTEEFFINKYDSYDNGYNLSSDGTGYGASNKGKLRIRKSDQVKFINANELTDYLNNGWIKDESSTMSGRYWAVNEENHRKAITYDQIPNYNDLGYANGRNWEDAIPFPERFPELNIKWIYRTTKDELQELRSTKNLGLSDEDWNKGGLLVQATSGTSGKNLLVPFNKVDKEVATTVGGRCFRLAGLHEGLSVIQCFNYCLHTGGFLDTLSLMKSGACVFPFGIGNTHELIETILTANIDALSCTPSYLPRIQKVLKEDFGLEPRDLHLKLGLFGGEGGIDNPEVRKSIEDLWGFSAINANYGSAETMSIFASEDGTLKNGLIFQAPDFLKAELYYKGEYLPINNPITNIGELTLTARYQGGIQRLNRYRMGDVIEVLDPKENFRFKVIGRADDMLVIKGINLYPGVIRDIFTKVSSEFNEACRFQIHVSKNSPITDIKLITDSSNKEFIYRVNKILKSNYQIKLIVTTGNIIEGKTGKTKLVVRDL